MMIQEFEKLTGLEVNAAEYKVIEEMYYEFDGDKQAFCKKFMKDNGIVKVLRTIAADLEGQKAEALSDLKTAREKVTKLEAQLEREQEWKPYTSERLVSQRDYDSLRKFGREMSDEEARTWIADEFGFAEHKITINRTMNTYEVNRHHQLRKSGEIDRSPCYDATDWYYVFFTVAGYEYEAYNGSLNRI